MQLLVFALAGRRLALPLATVERLVRAVEILPLPGAPAVVLGAVNVGGAIVPVFCLRRRLGLQEREVSPDQLLLLGKTLSRAVALMVDEAHGVVECSVDEVIRPAQIAPGLERFQGVVKLADGMVLIHDLEKFLSEEESWQLTRSLEQSA